MSVNAVYDAIEDEFIRYLESPTAEWLPNEFTITFSGPELEALIEGGLTVDGVPLTKDVDAVNLRLAGYYVRIQRESSESEIKSYVL